MEEKILVHVGFKNVFKLSCLLLLFITLVSGLLLVLGYMYEEALKNFQEEFGLVGILLLSLVLNIGVMAMFINILNRTLKLIGGIYLVFKKSE